MKLYENFKETMMKTIKTELSTKNAHLTNDALPQRIKQASHSEQARNKEVIRH